MAMVRVTNLLGIGVGVALIVVGLIVAVDGLVRNDLDRALLVGPLAAVWGGVVVLVCRSNLRRWDGASGA